MSGRLRGWMVIPLIPVLLLCYLSAIYGVVSGLLPGIEGGSEWPVTIVVSAFGLLGGSIWWGFHTGALN